MRSVKLILIATFVFVLTWPQVLYANDTFSDSGEQVTQSITEENVNSRNLNADDEEYNELGIKKGTMVHGEDISELDEWELQYVPEGWRDGSLSSEHPETKEQPQLKNNKKYPNVNNYIKSQKLKTAKIQYDHKDFFTKFNFRNGFGRPEGVVAHETANDKSNIAGEISYMTRNHKNAFVHAFVDHSQIIEIHPPDLGAWGAGRFANQRFIHIELVRVHNFDDFARSINNYSEYIAHLLYTYNLGVIDAEKSGKGTLWSHRAVSKFLGGTNHVDPHGYFAKWGYDWNEFVKLVEEKYTSLVDSKNPNTSMLGHIKSIDSKIYENPIISEKYKLAGDSHMNQVYYIKQVVIISNKKYYVLSTSPSNRNGVIGWIEEKDINAKPHVATINNKETLIIRGVGQAYNKAWGGKKNIVYDDLFKYDGQTFQANLVEMVGGETWYRGMLAGKQVWMSPNNISRETSTSLLGHIRNGSIKLSRTLLDPSTEFSTGATYTHAVYYIKKEARVNGELHYLLSTSPSSANGVVGWAKAADIQTKVHKSVDKNSKQFIVKGTGSAYNKAWGGKKNAIYVDLSLYRGEIFAVHLTETVGNDTWYRGTLAGKTVWIHANELSQIEEKPTSLLGHIRNGSVKLSRTLLDPSTEFSTGATYTNAVYYIKKEARVNGELHYLLSTSPSSVNGVVGWAKSTDIQSKAHKTVDKKSKQFIVKGTGSAYNKAWGGKKNAIYVDLSLYRGETFAVHLTETVGNDTWYRGTLAGKTVWIHANELSQIEEKPTSLLGHIRNGSVKLSRTLLDPSTEFSTGATYTNAVYYIKKEARVDSELYYLLSTSPSSVNGVVGWAKAADIQTKVHKSVDKNSKQFIVKGTGSAYNKAWGGKKNAIYVDLSLYRGQTFAVHLTETVGNDTWYRGMLAGKTVWIHSSNVN